MRVMVGLALIAGAVVALRLAKVSGAAIVELAMLACGAMIMWAGLTAVLAGLWVGFGVAMLATGLWRLQRRLKARPGGSAGGSPGEAR